MAELSGRAVVKGEAGCSCQLLESSALCDLYLTSASSGEYNLR